MAYNVLPSTVNAPRENYIHNPAAIFPLLQIPKVDLCVLNSEPSSPEATQELKILRFALTVCGFFQVVNHGIDISPLEELYDVTKRFFLLPPEEKHKYSRPAGDLDLAGFGNDQILTQHQTLDWNDVLYLDLYPEDQRTLKLWPDNPNDFRKVLLECRAKLQKLNELILKAMAKSLNLEDNTFLRQYGESPRVLSRFNSHHPCSGSGPQVEAKPHSDASALTFFLQDKPVEAFQVLRGDKWFRLPAIAHPAILVMPGDQAEIMTNGLFKSLLHRFVANSERERISISIFFIPDKENVIEPAEGLVDEKRPSLYRPVVDYVGAFYPEHREGNRVIDALKK
ncbi:protein LATERAL BRANCHING OXIDOREDUCTASE 1-like isoform X2 [Coffea arabica]|uniref:Protein LATERAL BRANCHING OXIDOREDUCTASE 1-like isoform X2 n=1 Tax=Coffea arabica TaxID=13443 RepID=A0ABM4UUC1_COFAR|nr:probable 2-oxoglutarate-dependent dioxygenase ANS isoform X2 [Coffea arabica]